MLGRLAWFCLWLSSMLSTLIVGTLPTQHEYCNPLSYKSLLKAT
jgi:hypothetical protein